jgi:hypothetical protein
VLGGRKKDFASILCCLRELLLKWGYYLELKAEADRLVEAAASRFPGQHLADLPHLGRRGWYLHNK